MIACSHDQPFVMQSQAVHCVCIDATVATCVHLQACHSFASMVAEGWSFVVCATVADVRGHVRGSGLAAQPPAEPPVMPAVINVGGPITGTLALILAAWAVRAVRALVSRARHSHDQDKLPPPDAPQPLYLQRLSATAIRMQVRSRSSHEAQSVQTSGAGYSVAHGRHTHTCMLAVSAYMHA